MPIVTVKVANSGTKLSDGGSSDVGHMWFSLKHENGEKLSYGFAPSIGGKGLWTGKVFTNDDNHYLSIGHKQSFFISDKEYNQLKEFANNPSKYGFNIYNGLSNSCVDFTWAALHQIGIMPDKTKDIEGEVWPSHNNKLIDEAYYNHYNKPKFNKEQKNKQFWIKSENEELEDSINSMNAYLDKKEDDKIDAKQDRISYLSSIGISDPSLQAKLAEMMETDEYKILEVEDAIAMNIHNANEYAQAVADNLNPIQQNNQGYSQSGSNNMQNVTSATVDAGGIGGMSC